MMKLMISLNIYVPSNFLKCKHVVLIPRYPFWVPYQDYLNLYMVIKYQESWSCQIVTIIWFILLRYKLRVIYNNLGWYQNDELKTKNVTRRIIPICNSKKKEIFHAFTPCRKNMASRHYINLFFVDTNFKTFIFQFGCPLSNH